MTCIVAMLNKGTIHMGADSAGVSPNSVTIRKDTKIFKVEKKMLIGYTSSFRMGQLLRYKLKLPKHPKKMSNHEYLATLFVDAVRKLFKDNGFAKISDNEESSGTFLIGYRNELFSMDADYQIAQPVEKYLACGSGEDYARGALHVLKDNKYLSEDSKLEAALSAAAELGTGVRPPFNLEILK